MARLGTWLTGGLLVLLVVIDFVVVPYPYGYTEVRAQPADHWLREQTDRGPIIHYPLEKTWYGWMVYPQRVHGLPMAYGYGTFMPRGYRQMTATLNRWPSAETVQLLQDWGIRYILIGARSYGDEWPTVRGQLERWSMGTTHPADGAQPLIREVAVLRDEPLFHGDRLLKYVIPTADVPSTELIAGNRTAYLDDEIHIYMLHEPKRP